MIKWVLVLLSAVYSFAGINYCDIVGYDIFADDATPTTNSTFLGSIYLSEANTYSIINSVGAFGSSYSSTSIYNTYGTFGSPYGSYSAHNSYASTPPKIYEYRAATGVHIFKGYVTTNTAKYPAYNPDDLRSVLKFGNCAGLSPLVFYDTVKVTMKDTVIRIDTLKLHDTTKVAIHDTTKVSIHDTTKITLRDTVVKIDTIIFKDTVKFCPQQPTLTKSSALSYKPSISTIVYGATGKPEWSGLLPLGDLPPVVLKDGLYIIVQGDQTRRLQVIHK